MPHKIPDLAIGSEVWPGLAKVMEESGELSQVIAKLLAYPDGIHPDGTFMIERLENEIADLSAALQYACWANAEKINNRSIDDRRFEKFDRFTRWHYQERNK